MLYVAKAEENKTRILLQRLH